MSRFLQTVPAFGTVFYWLLYPDTRVTPNYNPGKVTFPTFEPACIATLCASAHLYSSCNVTDFYSSSNIVPRHSRKPEKLYHDGKNRAMLHSTMASESISFYAGFHSPASARSAPQTPFIAGPLGASVSRR